ncbi:MAG: hypothetical protein LC789_10895 [Actinobacteria bacterium]|nr:hypothetical protein [Actinomycetota bacterium]
MTHYVVLAHAHPAALGEQVEDLRLVDPGCRISVFNGGRDPQLTAGLDVEVVPTSRPLRHGFLALFHGLTMEWARGPVVTLDSDAWVVRPLPELDYVAPHLAEVHPGTPWRPGRRFLPSWPRWKDLLELEHPLRCFNPVQGFGPAYAERFLSWPHRRELMDRIAATRLEALEEIVWPTLAVTLGISPQELPGSASLQLGRHAPRDLQRLLAAPDVHVLHKVGLEPGATDRRLVREHLHGDEPSFDMAPDYPVGPRPARPLAAAAKDLLHRAQRRR